MPNLTKCKDCGHTVSTRAKTCPHCGVRKPAKKRATSGDLFVIALALFLGGVWIASQLDSVDTGSSSSGRVQTASVRKPRVYTDAEIQEAIAKSDDYEIYRAEFTKAARTLLESRRCGRHEMTEYGGFVRSPTSG